MTIIAVIYAYLSDSLPEACLNEIDKKQISNFQAGLKASSAARILRSLRGCCGTLKRRLAHEKEEHVPHRRKLNRVQREEAITRFILCLSDQQLATGLAILLAAIANQCTLSSDEFRIAMALAWFSATTHLATLGSLKQYFITNSEIRNWRVFGMVILLVLLIYCFVVTLALEGADNTIPVQCTINHGASPLAFYWNVGWFDYLSWILALVKLIDGYKSRVLQSYDYHSSFSLELAVVILRLLAAYNKKIPKKSRKEWIRVLGEWAAEQSSISRRRLLGKFQECKREKAKRPFSSRLRTRVLVGKLIDEDYVDSLLPQLPLFLLAYGFAQMAYFRWGTTALRIDSSMGFGQITPIFLLVLPILAGGEIYYETATHAQHRTSERTTPYNESSERSSSFEATAINRANTLPPMCSSGTSDPELSELEVSGQRYDEKISYVKKYFRRESKVIQEAISSALDEEHMRQALKMKQAVLRKTEELQKLEPDLNDILSEVQVRRTWGIIQAVTLGILLNIPISPEVLFGAPILFTQNVLQLFVRATKFLAVLRRLRAEIRAGSGNES
ncbi:hypothetical protein BU26DRAFT_293113 [Trematosphaeria pertusa]|uniref:Uncharacterized protein n=1 Tax=Trematosphaeria pertusa TaxID=390896 RepID=A0A6A6IIU1_9PLEO|nr:uncharacterized protein BU26DRAFT_293113 [Trematosphaeria pertusa]KAF2249968.1 hypothetical protein BU26DRAFT_293113 [Trematosphaeria pertusa]